MSREAAAQHCKLALAAVALLHGWAPAQAAPPTSKNSGPPPAYAVASPTLSVDEIVEGISLCMRAVQPDNKLLLDEFPKAGWVADPVETLIDQNGSSYASYGFKKDHGLVEIRVYPNRPVCATHTEWVNDKRANAVKDKLLNQMGAIPSEEQEGFDDVKKLFLESEGENGGWPSNISQLSEKLYFFPNAALTVEIVMVGYNPLMVTNAVAIQQSQ